MIEQIAGPGSLSILSCKFSKAQVLSLTKDYFLSLKESKFASDRLVTSWGEWLSLEELTKQNLAPELWSLLLHRLALIYKDSFLENPALPLFWDQRYIFYELSKADNTYTVLIDQPKFIILENEISETKPESKVRDFAEATIGEAKITPEKSVKIYSLPDNSPENSELAEAFFQTLLEQYLLNLSEMNEEAESWLLARDKPWPGLIEAILDESIVQGSPEYPMRRIEEDQSIFPNAIPLACLTHKIPGKDQLKTQDLFWIEGDVIIGSSPENADYLLRSSLVMSEHARIWEEGGIYKLVHMGAKGSVKVNGKAINKDEPYELPLGCEIQVGDCTFFFYYETTLYESKDLRVA